MSMMSVHGADLFVDDVGGDGPPVLFLHGFLFDGRQFEAQVEALRAEYRCVTIDFRGQGRSAPTRGGYQVERQAADVVTVIRRLNLAPVHLVGLSMGGFVGMRLAARQPELLRSLTLVNSSAAPHARLKQPKHASLAAVARAVGLSPLTAAVEEEMYGPDFLEDPRRDPERQAWRQRWADADRASLVRTLLGFLVRPDMRPELGDITVPTLVIAGGEDASLPAPHSQEMHRLIRGSQYVELAGVGHSSPVEAPDAVTSALAMFLADAESPARSV